jgi:protein O-mannosyl-transferase
MTRTPEFSDRSRGACKPSSSPTRIHVQVPHRLSALIPLALALAAAVAFLPSLEGGFVWDDKKNLLDNPQYRGFGLAQIGWMLTAFHSGHYIPVTWMSFALDYVLWGMHPAGYHLTNLLLHATNTAIFYLVALRLLGAGLSSFPDPFGPAVRSGAALAALLFALHPLRAESVAWVTERRDLLSALFYLLAVLAYLRACEARGPASRILYVVTLSLFVLALLSKSMAVSLPVILLLLDVYPLRRLGGGAGRWLGPEARRVWIEKIPFVLLSLAASSVAVLAVRSTGITLAPLASLGVLERVAISAYALAFYLWKTAVPVGLTPLYELALPVDPLEWPFLLSGVVVLTITTTTLVLGRRWPALRAVWLAYVAILLPVVGVVQNGPQIAADRYTYLSCLGWALLAAGGLLTLWRANSTGTRAVAFMVSGLALLGVAGLGGLTWKQVQVWHDSERLWRHAVLTSPSAIGHHNLGVALLDRGALGEAGEHFRETIRRLPGNAQAHNHFGVALARRGEIEQAIPHFRQAIEIDPAFQVARGNLDRALYLRGRVPPIPTR